MGACPLYVEPFCGAAATALALVDPSLRPPVGWMGGKRRLASVLLTCLGLRPGQGADRVLLADPGEWGWVWPALLTPAVAAEVARVLRLWQEEIDAGRLTPEELWCWLALAGPRREIVEGTAGWLYLQGRAVGGWPTWWEEAGQLLQAGPRPGQAKEAVHRPPAGQGASGAGLSAAGLALRVERLGEEAAGWLVLQSQTPSSVAVIGDGARWSMGGDRWPNSPPRKPIQRNSKAVRPSYLAGNVDRLAEAAAGWLTLQQGSALGKPIRSGGEGWAAHGYAHVTPAARARGFQDRVRPGQVADLLRGATGPLWAVYHGRAEALGVPGWVPPGTVVLLDPPYVGCTGYGHDASREMVLDLARRWSAAGAQVLICEAVGLAGELGCGWHEIELTDLEEVRSGPEWVTSNRPIPQVIADRVALAQERRAHAKRWAAGMPEPGEGLVGEPLDLFGRAS